MRNKYSSHRYMDLSLEEYKLIGSKMIIFRDGKEIIETLPQHIEKQVEIIESMRELQLPNQFILSLIDVLLRGTDLGKDVLTKLDLLDSYRGYLSHIIFDYLTIVSVLHDLGKTYCQPKNERVFFSYNVKGVHFIPSTIATLELINSGILDTRGLLHKFIKITGVDAQQVYKNFHTLITGAVVHHHEPMAQSGNSPVSVGGDFMMNLSFVNRYLHKIGVVKKVNSRVWFYKSVFEIDKLGANNISEYFVSDDFIEKMHNMATLEKEYKNKDIVDFKIITFYYKAIISKDELPNTSLDLLGFSDLFYLFMMIDNMSAKCVRGGNTSALNNYLMRYPHFRSVFESVETCGDEND